MNRLDSHLPRGQYFAIRPSPGVPEKFTLLHHLNMGREGPLPENSLFRYTQENIDEFCDSRANIRARFPKLRVLEKRSPQNYRVNSQDCLFASYRDDSEGPDELLDSSGIPISVHSQIYPPSSASFLSPVEAQRKRPAPSTLSATSSNSSSSSSSRTPKSSRRDSSSTQISKREVLTTDGPRAAAVAMHEAFGSLPRGSAREIALASFHGLLTPEDKRHMQRACAATAPESFADQLEGLLVSELNKVRAHLVAKHRELSGTSSAEKFVNADGELRLRSDDEDKAIYNELAPTVWRAQRVACMSDTRLRWLADAKVAHEQGSSAKVASGLVLRGDELGAAIDAANLDVDRSALRMMDIAINSRTQGGIGIGALSHGAIKAACAMKFGGLAESVMDGFSANSIAAGRGLVDKIEKQMAAMYTEAYDRLLRKCIEEKRSWMRMRDNMNKVHNR